MPLGIVSFVSQYLPVDTLTQYRIPTFSSLLRVPGLLAMRFDSPRPSMSCFPKQDSNSTSHLQAQYTLLPTSQGPEDTASEHQTIDFSEYRVSKSVIQVHAHHRFSETASEKVPVTWAQVLNLWASGDQGFASAFRRVLHSSPFRDFFWECPPLSSHTTSQPFQFVLIDAGDKLAARMPSSSDFELHLARASISHAQVTAFPNLGNDAELVVPAHLPGTPKTAYGHLAAFTRHADMAQQRELWRVVAQAVQSTLQDDPLRTLWLSTDGRGVPWLHVRLDRRPKYTKHPPYACQRPPELFLEPSAARHLQNLLPAGPTHTPAPAPKMASGIHPVALDVSPGEALRHQVIPSPRSTTCAFSEGVPSNMTMLPHRQQQLLQSHWSSQHAPGHASVACGVPWQQHENGAHSIAGAAYRNGQVLPQAASDRQKDVHRQGYGTPGLQVMGGVHMYTQPTDMHSAHAAGKDVGDQARRATRGQGAGPSSLKSIQLRVMCSRFGRIGLGVLRKCVASAPMVKIQADDALAGGALADGALPGHSQSKASRVLHL